MGDRLCWRMDLSNVSVYSAHELGDRIPEISSSDRASFPAGLLGQRLGQFYCIDERCDRQSSQARLVLFKPMRSPNLVKEK
jgi:hypothetical protein